MTPWPTEICASARNIRPRVARLARTRRRAVAARAVLSRPASRFAALAARPAHGLEPPRALGRSRVVRLGKILARGPSWDHVLYARAPRASRAALRPRGSRARREQRPAVRRVRPAPAARPRRVQAAAVFRPVRARHAPRRRLPGSARATTSPRVDRTAAPPPFLALARASPPPSVPPRAPSPRAPSLARRQSNQPTTTPDPSPPPAPREPAPPPAPAEQTTRTTTIRNHVNLKKSTLEVVPASPDRPNLLTVKFTFDANVDCWASVFPVATEHPKEGCRLTTEGEAAAPPRDPRTPRPRPTLRSAAPHRRRRLRREDAHGIRREPVPARHQARVHHRRAETPGG